MRIASRQRPVRRYRDTAFTAESRLRGMVVRMITLNSLGAFTQEIARRPAVEAARGFPPAAGTGTAVPAVMPASQRTLEAVPPPPSRPLPRGSLVDLRV